MDDIIFEDVKCFYGLSFCQRLPIKDIDENRKPVGLRIVTP